MTAGTVIAIGGNALIGPGQRGSIAEQFENARQAARRFADVVQAGGRVVLTHGNGPQVGFILLRSESLTDATPVPRLSLDMCVADTQGGLGYIIGSSLVSELGRRGQADRVACLLTHTVVDGGDPAFALPTKPIGPFFSPAEARRHEAQDGWAMGEDAGRGWRRLVPSPRPLRVVETAAVRTLFEAGFVVIAGGGGGIPVVETEPGVYRGVEAVVDKDFTSALLATALGIPTLVLATGVEKVAVGFGTPRRRDLDRVSAAEMRRHLEAGEFPPGSMGPKIQAALEFLERGGRAAIVTSLDRLGEALDGRAGTRIVRD